MKDIVIFFLSIFFILPACNLLKNSKEEVVMTVGQREITEEDLKNDVKYLTFEMGITDQEAKLGMQTLINKAVEDYLILEYGKENHIAISEGELESAIRNIKKDYPEDVFQSMLLQRYIDFNEWKKWLERGLLIKKIVLNALAQVPPVSYQETKAYYESHQDEFQHPRKVELVQIVISTREEAKEIMKHLTEGANMGELAEQYSIAPEANKKGYLGWITEGYLDEPIDKVIFSLPVGKISTIVESHYGYHIFQVLASQPEGYTSLPESMEYIESKLILEKKDQFYQEWLRTLKNRFPVTVKKQIPNDWSLEG
jgi:parvulin-like peptidyl-prolyl isomerase